MRKFPPIYILELLYKEDSSIVPMSAVKTVGNRASVLLPDTWVDLSSEAIEEALKYTDMFVEVAEGYVYTGYKEIRQDNVRDNVRLWFNNHPHYLLLLNIIDTTKQWSTRKERVNVGTIFN